MATSEVRIFSVDAGINGRSALRDKRDLPRLSTTSTESFFPISRTMSLRSRRPASATAGGAGIGPATISGSRKANSSALRIDRFKRTPRVGPLCFIPETTVLRIFSCWLSVDVDPG